MFRQILFTQWRWGALMVGLLGVLGIALPLAVLYDLPQTPSAILDRVQLWGYVFPVFAVLTGLLLGMSAWAADHRGGHVYALTLPIPRWYYALLRYGAGVLLTLGVAVALWLGALIGTSGLALPSGLHAYAGPLALRFVLASVLAYSVVFAVASATNRTAGWILAGLGGLVLAQIIAGTVSGAEILEPLWLLLVHTGGPFELFTGSWLLVAV